METALAAVSAFGGLAGFTALVISLWQTKKRRLVPDPALRSLLEELLQDFNSLIAAGGQRVPWFLDDARQSRSLQLSSLQGAIVDENLHAKVAAARTEYNDAWACASPTHAERQLKFAAAGREAASGAIDRLNVIVYKHGHFRA